MTRSEAIRAALVEAAARRHDKHALAEEAAALEADADGRAEMLAGTVRVVDVERRTVSASVTRLAYLWHMIGGIVLAAGLSERMSGSLPKQLLPLAAAPMVTVAVRNAEASALDQVVVVTGYQADEVAAAVAGGRSFVVNNPDFRDGNMTSFRAGHGALPDCDAYVVLLADMPGVSPEIIDRVVDAWARDEPWAAISSYQDGRGHPLLLSATAMAQAVRATGTKGVWRFLNAAPEGRVVDIVFDRPMPSDVNTRDDYEGLDS